MVMVERQKKGGTMMCKTVAVDKNLNSVLLLALIIKRVSFTKAPVFKQKKIL